MLSFHKKISSQGTGIYPNVNDLTHGRHRLQVPPDHITGIVLALPGPTYDLVAVGTDLIAEPLHGKDGEWLLELGGELLNPEETNGNEGSGGDHHDVIPRVRERLVEGEGEEQQPGGEESGRVAGVEEGHGRREETLTPTQSVLEDGKVGVNRVLPHEVHWELFDRHREVEQGAVRTVHGGDDGLGLGRR